MSDSAIISRFTGRVGVEALASQSDDELCDNFGCFGWLRGVRERAIMLELRKKNGNILAIGYSWVDRVEFNPSEGITLHMAGQKINIKGRGLNYEVRPLVRLFDGITRHRVPWVQEADEPALVEGGQRGTLIESITWS